MTKANAAMTHASKTREKRAIMRGLSSRSISTPSHASIAPHFSRRFDAPLLRFLGCLPMQTSITARKASAYSKDLDISITYKIRYCKDNIFFGSGNGRHIKLGIFLSRAASGFKNKVKLLSSYISQGARPLSEIPAIRVQPKSLRAAADALLL